MESFNCRRISVIFHRSASDKQAVDSLVLLVCGPVWWTESNFPKERETECLPYCLQSKICGHVSGKLSKYPYIHSYTHRIINFICA